MLGETEKMMFKAHRNSGWFPYNISERQKFAFNPDLKEMYHFKVDGSCPLAQLINTKDYIMSCIIAHLPY